MENAVKTPKYINIAWNPHPGPQTTALQRSEFEVLVGGARGGGKTEGGLAWLIDPKYISNPRYQGLVIRRNADDLSDWVLRAQLFYQPCRASFAGKPPIIKFPSGATIKCGHLKDEKAYTKYIGHEYQKILIEELTLIPREADYEKLISSCRTTVPELPAQVFASTNPGGVGHVWVKARWVDFARNKVYYDPVSGTSRIFIPMTMDDNPTLMSVDPMYVKRIEAIKDEKLRNAWRYGDWDTFSGQYFDTWSRDIHVVKPFAIPDAWLRFRGFDWGYTAQSAVLWVAIDFYGNHYVYREFYESGNTPRVVAQKVLRKTGKDEVITATLADPSIWAKNQYGTGPDLEQATTKSIFGQMAEAGFYCTKANNDRINGWNKVRDLLYWDENLKPKLYVFDNCPETIRTIPSMIHDENNVEDVDKKCEEHIPCALRYLAMHTVSATEAIRPKTEMEQIIDRITTPADGAKPWGDV